MAASRMCSGVSKSGSPAPSPMTSRPAARSSAARAVTAMVGEGRTRLSRLETVRLNGLPPGEILRRMLLEHGQAPNRDGDAADPGAAGDRGDRGDPGPYS